MEREIPANLTPGEFRKIGHELVENIAVYLESRSMGDFRTSEKEIKEIIGIIVDHRKVIHNESQLPTTIQPII